MSCKAPSCKETHERYQVALRDAIASCHLPICLITIITDYANDLFFDTIERATVSWEDTNTVLFGFGIEQRIEIDISNRDSTIPIRICELRGPTFELGAVTIAELWVLMRDKTIWQWLVKKIDCHSARESIDHLSMEIALDEIICVLEAAMIYVAAQKLNVDVEFLHGPNVRALGTY
jgi:hypothetical protein